MRSLPHHRQITSWAILCAMLLVAIAPGVSRALASMAQNGAPWSEVCTANASPDSARTGRDSAQHLLDHCALCPLQADANALSPAPTLSTATLTLQHAAPHHARPSSHLSGYWINAQARAPPTFS